MLSGEVYRVEMYNIRRGSGGKENMCGRRLPSWTLLQCPMVDVRAVVGRYCAASYTVENVQHESEGKQMCSLINMMTSKRGAGKQIAASLALVVASISAYLKKTCVAVM